MSLSLEQYKKSYFIFLIQHKDRETCKASWIKNGWEDFLTPGLYMMNVTSGPGAYSGFSTGAGGGDLKIYIISSDQYWRLEMCPLTLCRWKSRACYSEHSTSLYIKAKKNILCYIYMYVCHDFKNFIELFLHWIRSLARKLCLRHSLQEINHKSKFWGQDRTGKESIIVQCATTLDALS